jgi:copper chaperone NosL
MKLRLPISLALGLVFGLLPPAWAQTPAAVQPAGPCQYCGMDRSKFPQSRVRVVYQDGSIVEPCSIHCAALELGTHLDKTPKAIKVHDYNTKEFIDAEKAFWVIGGKQPGVMTLRAKWAFAREPEAQAFIKENGGKLSSFDDVMKATYEDMYEDTKMIRAKEAKMKEIKAREHQP